MNKKFTFMVAALLAAGGFSANAAILDDLEIAQSIKSGNSYYVFYDNDQEGVGGTTSEFFLNVTSDGETLTFANIAGDTEHIDYSKKSMVWKVTEESISGKVCYTFFNEESKTYLALGVDGSMISVPVKEASTTNMIHFYFGDGTTKYNGTPMALRLLGGTAEGGNGVVVSKSYLDANQDASTTAFYLMQSKDNQLTADGTHTNVNVDNTLNKHLGGEGFSLNFPLADGEPALQGNVFSQPMKAFYFSDATIAPKAGTYFAVKYPENGEIKSPEQFKASTFVIVEPNGYKDINGTTRANGEGFTFGTIQGRMLVDLSTLSGQEDKEKAVTNKQVSADNAIFTVIEKDPTNAAGKLTVSLASIDVIAKAGDKTYTTVGGVSAGVIKSENVNRLLTVADANAKDAVFAVSTVATPADLLKADAPAVYTIQFTSGKDAVSSDEGSEYDKYLYSYSDGSAWSLVAEGTKYVDVKNPVAQWTISDYDKDNNTFTFRNRLTAETIELSLNKLGNNEYKVLSADNKNFKYGKNSDTGYTLSEDKGLIGTTVKLTASAIDKTAGFATIEDKVLSDFASLKFDIPAGAAVSGELFLNVADGNSPRTVKALADASKATKFSVVKFDGATSESDVAVTDTVYVVNGYKYWDADKKEVKSKISGDTLAYVTYAFKQVTNDGKNWYLHHDGKVKTVAESYNTPKFILKENLNGTYALLPTYVRTDATEEVFAASSVDGAIVTTEKLYGSSTNARDFSIVFDETNPSLKAESKHVAFNTSLGYIAMNENSEGIVAPVSSLKAEYSKEDLTFWLDTADSKAVTPSFLISKAGKFMYNATDSAYYYDSESATEQVNKDFLLADGETVKAMFQAATLKDSETITVNEKDYTAENGLNNFKFQIVQNTEDSEGEYVIRSLRDYKYLTNSNGKLGFTEVKANALVVSVETMEAPTSNESVSASEVAVVAQNGSVVVKNAAGKNVVVSTILGQVVANEVLTSDNATINVPAGIVVVAVEGESFKVNVK